MKQTPKELKLRMWCNDSRQKLCRSSNNMQVQLSISVQSYNIHALPRITCTYVIRLVITETGITDSDMHRAVNMASDRLSSSLNAFRNFRILIISSSSGFSRYLYLCNASLVNSYGRRKLMWLNNKHSSSDARMYHRNIVSTQNMIEKETYCSMSRIYTMTQ